MTSYESLNNQQKLELAVSPSTDLKMLAILGSDPDPNIREKIAANPSTPAHVFVRLLYDEEFIVRFTLARNPYLPEPLLYKLLKDTNKAVRTQAASNPQLDVDSLRILAKSLEADVLLGVVMNPSTPSDVIIALSTCENEGVRHWALEHRNAPQEVQDIKSKMKIRKSLLTVLEMEGITEEQALGGLTNPKVKTMM